MGRPPNLKINESVRNILNNNNIFTSNVPKPGNIIWNKCSAELAAIGIQISAKNLYTRAMKLKPNDENSATFLVELKDCVKCFNNEAGELRNGWTDVIFEYMYQLFDNKCVWKFKRGRMHPSKTSYFSFDAYCKECNSLASGMSSNAINRDGLTVTVIGTISCSPCQTSNQKRPLTGTKRENIGHQLVAQHKPPFALRCEMANKTMLFGEEEPPTLYSANVGRIIFSKM